MKRRQAQAELGPDRVEALRSAERTRDKRLRELHAKFAPRIAQLEASYAEERRKVWAEFDEQRHFLSKAVVLGRKRAGG